MTGHLVSVLKGRACSEPNTSRHEGGTIGLDAFCLQGFVQLHTGRSFVVELSQLNTIGIRIQCQVLQLVVNGTSYKGLHTSNTHAQTLPLTAKSSESAAANVMSLSRCVQCSTQT